MTDSYSAKLVILLFLLIVSSSIQAQDPVELPRQDSSVQNSTPFTVVPSPNSDNLDSTLNESEEEELPIDINETDDEKSDTDYKVGNSGNKFEGFNFGPGLFAVFYKDGIETFASPDEIVMTGDSMIKAPGSKYNFPVGLEAHVTWNLPWFTYRFRSLTDTTEWKSSRGVAIGPSVGIYDFENGVNGFAIGGIVSAWKGDENFERKIAFNIGITYSLHRRQLVLADGIEDGGPMPPNKSISDLTTRGDLEGWTIVFSAHIGL